MTDAFEDRPGDDALAQAGVLLNLRSDAAQAVLLLGELRWLTKWDEETLCSQLGCDPSRWTDAGEGRSTGRDALKHSLNFLSLVRDVARLVDITEDRRAAVNGAFELCADADGPVLERVPRIRAALSLAPSGDLKPSELLSLGEVTRAWRLAALNIGSGPAYERAVAAARLTGPLTSRTGHLSAQRLRLLAEPEPAELLGGEVSARMLDHLRVCQKCARLFAEIFVDKTVREPLLLRYEARRPVEYGRLVAL
ncbi:MAG: hypothetical protein WAN93_00880 [Solirubrobacteraceae bacterium]